MRRKDHVVSIRLSDKEYSDALRDQELAGFGSISEAGRTRWMQSIGMSKPGQILLGEMLALSESLRQLFRSHAEAGVLTADEVDQIWERHFSAAPQLASSHLHRVRQNECPQEKAEEDEDGNRSLLN